MSLRSTIQLNRFIPGLVSYSFLVAVFLNWQTDLSLAPPRPGFRCQPPPPAILPVGGSTPLARRGAIDIQCATQNSRVRPVPTHARWRIESMGSMYACTRVWITPRRCATGGCATGLVTVREGVRESWCGARARIRSPAVLALVAPDVLRTRVLLRAPGAPALPTWDGSRD